MANGTIASQISADIRLIKLQCSVFTYLFAFNGLFPWGKEDPSTRKIQEGGTTFRHVRITWRNFGPRGYQMEKELNWDF